MEFDPHLEHVKKIEKALLSGLMPESADGKRFFDNEAEIWRKRAVARYPGDTTTHSEWVKMVKHYGAVKA